MSSLECKVVDARMATRRNFFILQVLKTWSIDPGNTLEQFTIAAAGFMVAGKTIRLRSQMK